MTAVRAALVLVISAATVVESRINSLVNVIITLSTIN